MTRIEVHTPTTGTASLDDPASFLPLPARPAGPDRWTCRLAVGPWHHHAVVTVGARWRDGDRVGHPIAWVSSPEPGDPLPWEALTPRVHGMLSLEEGRVVLRTSYVPPVGIIGRLVDLGLRPVARRSMVQFVRAVAHRLSTPAVASITEVA